MKFSLVRYLKFKVGLLKENRIFPVLLRLAICLKLKYRRVQGPGAAVCIRSVAEAAVSLL
jgi:hypothetical protein